MKIETIKTRILKANENLFDFIIEHLPETLPEKSVVVVTSKIVALAEGSVVAVPEGLSDAAREDFKADLIKKESEFAIRTKYVWLTIKDNLPMPSAGIDDSNADGKLILLPRDSFASAEKIRADLMSYFNIKELGVLVTDSRLLPLRKGSVGVVTGYAGIKGLKPYEGEPDLFGRTLQFSRVDIADSLATAAVVLMGEGDECKPLAVMYDTPADFVDNIDQTELHIDPAEDLYKPLFEGLE
jgi:F420-0:gamma-glutamyl ligase